MRIAICEDEPRDRQVLEAYIYSYCSRRGLPVSVDCYADGEALLQATQPFGALFMDVFLTGADGTEIVARLLSRQSCPVVFVTSSREHAVEAFHLGAVHYLLKPVTQQAVDEAMERCLAQLDRPASPVLTVKSGHDTLPVSVERIVYIEASNKLSLIHTDGGTIRTYTSLGSLWSALDHGVFLRPQRSFIVHMGCIETLHYDALVLKNGVEIRLSRSNRTFLKQQYQRYLFDLARRGGQ